MDNDHIDNTPLMAASPVAVHDNGPASRPTAAREGVKGYTFTMYK